MRLNPSYYSQYYTRRDYEPVTKIIDVKPDCDNDTLLVITRGDRKILRAAMPLNPKSKELDRLEFRLQSPGINNGLIMSVIVGEDWRPLMVGFKNQEALANTLTTGLATFQTRSRGGKLWTKGETSGDYISITGFRVAGRNSLILTGIPKGAVCHTGAKTCFEKPLSE